MDLNGRHVIIIPILCINGNRAYETRFDSQ